jgi:hypothetical protein
LVGEILGSDAANGQEKTATSAAQPDLVLRVLPLVGFCVAFAAYLFMNKFMSPDIGKV